MEKIMFDCSFGGNNTVDVVVLINTTHRSSDDLCSVLSYLIGDDYTIVHNKRYSDHMAMTSGVRRGALANIDITIKFGDENDIVGVTMNGDMNAPDIFKTFPSFKNISGKIRQYNSLNRKNIITTDSNGVDIMFSVPVDPESDDGIGAVRSYLPEQSLSNLLLGAAYVHGNVR